jgi:hypothetical protein
MMGMPSRSEHPEEVYSEANGGDKEKLRRVHLGRIDTTRDSLIRQLELGRLIGVKKFC